MNGINWKSLKLNEQNSLIIIGGVHGAGKSTFCNSLQSQKKLAYITPEELKKDLAKETSHQTVLKNLLQRTNDLLENGESFYFEHTMSGNFVAKLIIKAKEQHFHVHLIYIDIASPEQAITRINQRVENNGHDVDRTRITKRLKESRSNFYCHYRELADSWEIYNNDSTYYRRIANSDNNDSITMLYNQFLHSLKS